MGTRRQQQRDPERNSSRETKQGGDRTPVQESETQRQSNQEAGRGNVLPLTPCLFLPLLGTHVPRCWDLRHSLERSSLSLKKTVREQVGAGWGEDPPGLTARPVVGGGVRSPCVLPYLPANPLIPVSHFRLAYSRLAECCSITQNTLPVPSQPDKKSCKPAQRLSYPSP